jgi:AraC-like DNA-binding protein
MRGRPGSLFYFAPRSLPRSRYAFVGAMGIHEMMPRGYIRHGGPSWPFFLLMHFFSPAAIRMVGGDQVAVGRTILWEPFSEHFYGNPRAQWDHSWVNLCGSAVEEIVKEERITLNTPLDLAFEGSFERYSRLLYDELHSRAHQDMVMLASLVRMWLHELGMTIRATHQVGIPEALVRARQYAESHYRERITLRDLTTAAGLSASQLSALFRRFFGLPPVEYLINLRIKRAELLLVNQNLSISEVSDRTGFSDPLYFSRQFKNRTGVSPSTYRTRSTFYPPLTDPRNPL